MDIADLIREAKQGSAAAQKCLFDQLANQMLAVCRRYVKNQEDAEELLLDGFLKFFKNLDDFIYRGDAALMGWIKKIMVNECLMFLRKKNVFTLLTETAAEDPARWLSHCIQFV
jgi:RNA polymerase sigma factor (sigma-70 family)